VKKKILMHSIKQWEYRVKNEEMRKMDLIGEEREANKIKHTHKFRREKCL
jgi:hypothetical protein